MKRSQLRRVFDVVNGGTPTSEPSNWDGEIAWATPVDLAKVNGKQIASTERTLTAEGLDSGSRTVPKGSIIVSTRAPIGYVAECSISMAFNQGCKGLVAREPVDIRFYRYQLSALAEQLGALGQGSTFVELSGDALAGVEITTPSLGVQSTIADFLDVETARIDTLIEKKLELNRLLDTKIDSLIFELVGAIPMRRRLRHLAKLGTGHTPDRRNSEYWENCVVPWVTAEDLSSRDNPFEILIDTRQKISTLGVAKSAAVVHPSGTVMLCRTASIGLICRIGIPMATTQAFVTWSPGPELNSGFLMYALHSLRQEWMRLAFGSTHDTIYMPDLESVKIPYVPIAEQIMISRKLDTSTSRLLEAKELLNRQCKTLKELRQALITAAVTGEIEIPEAAA